MSTLAVPVSPAKPPMRAVTWAGLFLALFGLVLIRQVLRLFWPQPDVTFAVVRETLFWMSGVALLSIIRRGEGLPLSSIGLGTSKWWKSILWGTVLTVACLVAAVMLGHLTGYGKASHPMDKYPLWLVTWTVFRAGILEEVFYRGYAIERLQVAGLSRGLAAGIPLLIFAIGHWTGGWTNIAMAFVIGSVLTGFYMWKRDLVANMFAHTMVDFVGNVLPRLLG